MAFGCASLSPKHSKGCEFAGVLSAHRSTSEDAPFKSNFHLLSARGFWSSRNLQGRARSVSTSPPCKATRASCVAIWQAINCAVRVEPAAATQFPAQLQPLQQHIARLGSAGAGKRCNIATFDVIPAGSSSDVCPDHRLHMNPLENGRVAQCRMKQTLLRNWA